MIDFTRFSLSFGTPRPGTAADLQVLGLTQSTPLRDFASQVGGGAFAHGLISVLSIREQVSSLGGWEKRLPSSPKLFATSAFGLLLLTTGEDVWIADTQNNDVFKSDMIIHDVLLKFCEKDIREEHLHEALFLQWRQGAPELEPTKVLSLTPALALGGTWSCENLRETDLGLYLSFTAQLFG